MRSALTATGAALLLLIGLAGCGGGDSGTSAAPGTASGAAATTAGDGSRPAAGAGRGGADAGPGGDESAAGEASGAASPEEAARLFLVSGDAERVCGTVLDPELLKATYGDLSGCVAGRRPPTLARDPGLGEPRVAEGRARLTANPRGGLYDDQRLTFTAGEAEDGWRIERITSNVQVGP